MAYELDDDRPTASTQTLTDQGGYEVEPPREAAPLAAQPRTQLLRPVEPPRAQPIERVIVRHSEQVDKLFEALAAAQGEFTPFEKTETATVDSKRTGAKYSYTYETLADVLAATRPALSRHGVSFMQFPFPGPQTVTVRTMLGHASGQWLYSDLTASIASLAPQDVGSGITFLRRYAAKSILGVAAADEDDDGAQASGRRTYPEDAVQPAPRKSQQQQPAPAARPAPAAPPARVGKVREITEKGNAALVMLETGFACGTGSPDLIAALARAKADDQAVELRTRPSSNPAKYAPVLEEVVIVRDAAQ